MVLECQVLPMPQPTTPTPSESATPVGDMSLASSEEPGAAAAAPAPAPQSPRAAFECAICLSDFSLAPPQLLLKNFQVVVQQQRH